MHIINRIFNEFERRNIRYCHFKSNQHLDESFDGIADFDVLVDHKSSSSCEIALLEMNCKRFEPVKFGDYAGVENWIAFDPESGKIFHLHLHYQLVSGKALVKEYVLPWSELFLSHSVKSAQYHIMIPDPNYEMVLLMARNVIKTKWRKKCQAFFTGYSMPKDIKIEYDYLKRLIGYKELNMAATAMLGESRGKSLATLIMEKDDLNRREFFKVSKTIRSALKDCRRYGACKAQACTVVRRFLDLKNKFLSQYMNAFSMPKKVSKSGGRIIAFVGIDGCGKSTTAGVIRKWLSYKIEVKRFYMGEGDGQVPLFARIVKGVYGLFGGNKKSGGKKKESDENERISFKRQPGKYIKKYVRALMIFSVVKANRKKIEKMERYRMNGGYSVLDRFPQLQSEGLNDGLKLKKFADQLGSRHIAKLAKKEEKLMQIVKRVQPDLLFRLIITPETSMKRKPEEQTDYESIRKKAEQFNGIKYSAAKIIDIDAEKPYEEVLLDIKREIWKEA